MYGMYYAFFTGQVVINRLMPKSHLHSCLWGWLQYMCSGKQRAFIPMFIGLQLTDREVRQTPHTHRHTHTHTHCVCLYMERSIHALFSRGHRMHSYILTKRQPSKELAAYVNPSKKRQERLNHSSLRKGTQGTWRDKTRLV